MTNRRMLTLTCFIAFITLGIAASLLGPTLQPIADSLSLPLAHAEVLRVVRQIGTFIAILVGGRLLDRYEARRAVVPGLFLMVIGLIGTIAGNLPIALAAALLIGMGGALLDVGSNYLFGSLYGAGAASVLTALHTFYGVGISTGPEVANWGLQRGDWRLAYLIAAAACAVVGCIFALMKMPMENHPSPPVVQTKTAAVAPTSLLKMIRWLPLLPLFALNFLYGGAGTGMGDLIPTHMQHALGASAETGARIATLYGISLTIGRLLGIWTLRRFGNLRILTFGVGVATLGAALIFFGAAVGIVSVGVILVGVGFAPVYPVVIAIGGQGQPELRGTIIGFLVAAATLGGLMLPYLQGLIGGGQNGGMIVTLAATLLMVIAIAYLHVAKRVPPVLA